MRLATYNLRFGGKAGRRIHWQKIFADVQPDIFLVQETLHPREYLPSYEDEKQQLHWKAVAGRPWGSAVYVRHGQVTPLAPLSAGLAGWVTGVCVTDFSAPSRSGQLIYVYSVHAPSGRSSYVKEVNFILDAIQAQVSNGADVIIGGDFNLTIGFRHPSEALQQNQPKLMARFQREMGLINCWQSANPNQNLPQTLRWSNDPSKPYHCDGLFVPASWYRYLESAEVLSGPDWEPLSDHNPVVATLSVARTSSGKISNLLITSR
ncbi:MAG: endonuclease/exonuclease/phosphatase family protein [Cyanobacteria bacterium J06635_15]